MRIYLCNTPFVRKRLADWLGARLNQTYVPDPKVERLWHLIGGRGANRETYLFALLTGDYAGMRYDVEPPSHWDEMRASIWRAKMNVSYEADSDETERNRNLEVVAQLKAAIASRECTIVNATIEGDEGYYGALRLFADLQGVNAPTFLTLHITDRMTARDIADAHDKLALWKPSLHPLQRGDSLRDVSYTTSLNLSKLYEYRLGGAGYKFGDAAFRMDLPTLAAVGTLKTERLRRSKNPTRTRLYHMAHIDPKTPPLILERWDGAPREIALLNDVDLDILERTVLASELRVQSIEKFKREVPPPEPFSLISLLADCAERYDGTVTRFFRDVEALYHAGILNAPYATSTSYRSSSFNFAPKILERVKKELPSLAAVIETLDPLPRPACFRADSSGDDALAPRSFDEKATVPEDLRELWTVIATRYVQQFLGNAMQDAVRVTATTGSCTYIGFWSSQPYGGWAQRKATANPFGVLREGASLRPEFARRFGPGGSVQAPLNDAWLASALRDSDPERLVGDQRILRAVQRARSYGLTRPDRNDDLALTPAGEALVGMTPPLLQRLDAWVMTLRALRKAPSPEVVADAYYDALNSAVRDALGADVPKAPKGSSSRSNKRERTDSGRAAKDR